MNILVTLDSNYILPLKVMLKSMFYNNKREEFTIYLIHSSITDEEIKDLEEYLPEMAISWRKSILMINISRTHQPSSIIPKLYLLPFIGL